MEIIWKAHWGYNNIPFVARNTISLSVASVDFVSSVPVDDITAAGQSSAWQRKVNYQDVYNQMKKVRFSNVMIIISTKNCHWLIT